MRKFVQLHDLQNLAACGGIFFDRMNKINKIFLYSLYPLDKLGA